MGRKLPDFDLRTTIPAGSYHYFHDPAPTNLKTRDCRIAHTNFLSALGVTALEGDIDALVIELDELKGYGWAGETVKELADAITSLAASVASYRYVAADADQTVTISLIDGVTTVYCTAAINTLTLAQNTGDATPNEKNIVRVINNTAGPLSVTDGTTTFTMIDQQSVECWWMVSTLKRGQRVYFATGKIDPRDQYHGEIWAAGTTEGTVWAAIAPYIPDTGDIIKGLGRYNGEYAVTTFTRTNSTTITMRWQSGGTFTAETIKADGSGTFATNELAVSW
jgi:hypothetical protein